MRLKASLEVVITVGDVVIGEVITKLLIVDMAEVKVGGNTYCAEQPPLPAAMLPGRLPSLTTTNPRRDLDFMRLYSLSRRHRRSCCNFRGVIVKIM